MENKTLLYDTFNAKYLTYKDVAKSFVPNNEFTELTGNSSILLMGSRGCGKTTLMKMLTPAGMYYWEGFDAERIKALINFTAVYIPSDIQWKNQFTYLSAHLKGKEKFAEVITEFLFASNIQIALCKTFHSVIGTQNSSEQEKIILEYEVCKNLGEVWKISEDFKPTFNNVELKILERVRTVNSLIKKKIFREELNNLEKEVPDYIFENFFDLVKLGCLVFEQKLELKEDHKWALCFDELEIVPKFIQIELIKYLRSVDQKYIFKLTTTPLFNLEGTDLEASQGNDFSPIKLWVYDEAGLRRWQKFCDKLVLNRFKTVEGNIIDLETIFGKHSLDEIIKEELNNLTKAEKKELGYNPNFKSGSGRGSAVNFLFKRLASKDSSFKDFLIKKNISSEDPYSYSPLIEKSIFLKYKVDAVYRLIYKERTRKTPPIHYGLPHIFDICDGNPRLVIGLIDDILRIAKFDINDVKNISKQDQSRIIYEASDRYFQLIKNHPDSTSILKDREVNLATDLINKIGAFMFHKLVKENFSPISPSTFRVDEELNHKYLPLLETALALGAIVYLDPIESLSNTGIVGKRFRLSAFLTPSYKIPSRKHSEIRLSTILNSLELNENGINNQLKIDY